MIRQVIPRVIKNVSAIKSMRMCTATENAKMEKSINKVTLLGRVGGEPQKRGNVEHPVVIFSLATHSNYKYMNGDFVQRTEWHKVCVFKPNLRDSVQTYLKKGQRVLVFGKMSYGEFKDEEGNTKPSAAIVADDVIFFQL
ncbi:PREDICTED: single-stranded DNA-binding protein, mitochondrial [Habropoda laboriosa]|uniref:single-stranded DNA-binding protein, mitochondrial n=1 Tax=Habropoda laboriosa TaxID=597456 RepID=UPI00083E0596|nr:PREDICTED: single-stranded DNA-binding protein, mitochondrial [Habropoda laboriosa]